MWQEILVAIIVLVAAIFVGKRFWNSFSGLKTGETSACGCDCSKCSTQAPSMPNCCSAECDPRSGVPGTEPPAPKG